MKKVILLFVTILILQGCSEKINLNKSGTPSYFIVYTDRYTSEHSYLIGYDDEGKVITNDTLEGTRYHNLMRVKESIHTYNGNNEYIYNLNTNKLETKVRHSNINSSIELTHVNHKDDFYYYIDNHGNDGDGYYNTIEFHDSTKKIRINGCVDLHYIVDDYIYILSSPLNYNTNNGMWIPSYTKIDYQNREILEQGELSDKLSFSGLNGYPYVSNDGMIYFIRNFYGAEDSSKVSQQIVKLDTRNNEIKKAILLSDQLDISNQKDEGFAHNLFVSNNDINVLYANGRVDRYNFNLEKQSESVIDFYEKDQFLIFDYCKDTNTISILAEDTEERIMTMDFDTGETYTITLEKPKLPQGVFSYGMVHIQ